MDFKSRRFILGLLAGTAVGVTFVLLKVTCWSPLLAAFVAAYVADARGPKESSMVGALVALPIWAAMLLQSAAQLMGQFPQSPLALILEVLLGAMLMSALGALHGSVIGLILRATRRKTVMF